MTDLTNVIWFGRLQDAERLTELEKRIELLEAKLTLSVSLNDLLQIQVDALQAMLISVLPKDGSSEQ